MTEERMNELREHFLSQTDKSEKVRMYEFFNHVKHEARMNSRERQRGDAETQHTPV